MFIGFCLLTDDVDNPVFPAVVMDVVLVVINCAGFGALIFATCYEVGPAKGLRNAAATARKVKRKSIAMGQLVSRKLSKNTPSTTKVAPARTQQPPKINIRQWSSFNSSSPNPPPPTSPPPTSLVGKHQSVGAEKAVQ